ncbi:hypothetical protein BXZ70DRAFT_1058347 [Cristinia sonorae]|uniref:Uncharacterized protein n=1 Tax=Cristinia sonorae TaxID=1940300 RepID=A0A8K0UCL2_9AGAR|nr:hypothetical protein BXZ70DRAFT_1058347 [Cristinia sonorae]
MPLSVPSPEDPILRPNNVPRSAWAKAKKSRKVLVPGPDSDTEMSPEDLQDPIRGSGAPFDEESGDNDIGSLDHNDSRCYHHTDVGNRGKEGLKGPLRRETHVYQNGCITDTTGEPIPPDSPPPLHTSRTTADWSPFDSRLQFEMAEFLYKRTQMSQSNIDWLMDAFAAFGYSADLPPPFDNHRHMHSTIDAIPLGDAPWHSFTATYTGVKPNHNVPEWMNAEYEVWCRNPRTIIRNMLANPAFKDNFDAAPFREYDSDNVRQYSNLMSGDWAWRQADLIAKESTNNHGAMFAPIILGSDKTTVSVATGQNEYYPLYISLGNITNNMRRAHRDAVALLGFLAIPKSDRKDLKDTDFRKFRRQLFHSSISTILQPLRAGMSKPEVARCPDGHFRRVIYGLGPYIADYPEQVLAACVVQGWCPLCPQQRTLLDQPVNGSRRSREHTGVLLGVFDSKVLWREYGVVSDVVPFTNDFPRADIHELLSGDLLHQVIKGAFKDHLVTWVGQYLHIEHGEARAKEILDEIDRRIAAAPEFPGLRRFHQGRDFKQWTGDDSKALMKVYIPAIKGLVPDEMVKAFSSFMEVCYLARRSVLTDTSLKQIENAIAAFHRHRKVFINVGVRPDGFSSLARQHSLDHYPEHIRAFGALNGLCSSITESKHIKAVKEPWRRSNRFEALGQMLLTNQRLDKLAAIKADFDARGMLVGSLLYSDEGEEEDGPVSLSSVAMARRAAKGYPKRLRQLANAINRPELPCMVSRFLYAQDHPDTPLDNDAALPSEYLVDPRVFVHTSATSTYYAPSDLSGINGMRRERIRSTCSWRNGPARHDCVVVETNPDAEGMEGLSVGRVRLLFSFIHRGKRHPCVLIDWYEKSDSKPDEVTGMWVVSPEYYSDGSRVSDVMHLDTILRNIHLLPVHDSTPIPRDTHFSQVLDTFDKYFVNKYADHHAHEILF